ncbi:MAG: hypothetical protein HFG57_07960 [Lachnospiraceae bacterium]|nr:hypothetical protein [Lachnospiraceae bacterium]MCI9105878.1 hypothetical protein [Lachnospiraceae bacterium]
MENVVIKILLSVIYFAYQDTRRDKVCRIFIPGDGRMFDKFERVLKKYVEAERDSLWQTLDTKALNVLDSPWFHRYLLYQTSVQEMYDWVIRNENQKEDENALWMMAAERAGEYAADCGEGATVRDGTWIYPMKRPITEEEKKTLTGFYQMVFNAIRSTIEEITPYAEDLEADGESHNMKNEKLTNGAMWRYIRYCIDHDIQECKDIMIRMARNGQWKSWVRQAAAEYCCRFMDVEEVCEKFIPGLHGKLFYWTIAQFADTRDERLKRILRNHAEYYTGQEMLRDICLVKMQDKDGTKRICRYLERMSHVPKAVGKPDPVLVIAEIKSIDLLDELERLIILMMRDNFRDRAAIGLRFALTEALGSVACAGEMECEHVIQLLKDKLEYYQCQYKNRFNISKDKKNCAMGKEWAETELAHKAADKLAALFCLKEDVWWRYLHRQPLGGSNQMSPDVF